jgi:hypothetical protein
MLNVHQRLVAAFHRGTVRRVKLSGVGREESLDELLCYTQLKTVYVMLG